MQKGWATKANCPALFCIRKIGNNKNILWMLVTEKEKGWTLKRK